MVYSTGTKPQPNPGLSGETSLVEARDVDNGIKPYAVPWSEAGYAPIRSFDGGPAQTRTGDLYRVKVAQAVTCGELH